MASPELPSTNRGERKTRVTFRCPNCRRSVHVVAVPVARSPRTCQLRLAQPAGPLSPGERLSDCPGCAQTLPSLTWGEFQDLLGATAW